MSPWHPQMTVHSPASDPCGQVIAPAFVVLDQGGTEEGLPEQGCRERISSPALTASSYLGGGRGGTLAKYTSGFAAKPALSGGRG